jgi:hypothetical protein
MGSQDIEPVSIYIKISYGAFKQKYLSQFNAWKIREIQFDWRRVGLSSS